MIGFGIYLFIGLKGLIGLFSIGSLVCYTGSFMQVVQGVTAIANTTGQIPQIIPTLDYYFDILHTESGKQDARSCHRWIRRSPLNSAMLASNTRNRKPMR